MLGAVCGQAPYDFLRHVAHDVVNGIPNWPVISIEAELTLYPSGVFFRLDALGHGCPPFTCRIVAHPLVSRHRQFALAQVL
ncbi:MAG TPA: hypothetical protein VM934_05665, partial [Pyrinomonadaceae bacterium]|nr:hypothetical protein [Pyrinomonadaceae bacterium]